MRRQYRKPVGLAVFALAAVAVAATAQEPTVRTRVRVTEPSVEAFRMMTGPQGVVIQARRGRLGVLVDLTQDASRDSVGARIAGVTPGGPAERAGVRTDDIVLRLNGTRLATGGAVRGDDAEGQSGPGTRLIELASRLDAGDTVRLDVRRGAQPMTFTFPAGESDTDVIVRRYMGDAMVGVLPRLREGIANIVPHIGGQGQFEVQVGRSMADIELVRINPGLAEYFGTSEGLLVVDAPSDSSLGLRSGDVILSIGGRRPTSPAHALRILSTYDAGENVSFEIYRSKRRTTVNGRMPAERSPGWRMYRNSLEGPSVLFDRLRDLPELEGLHELEALPHGELLPATPGGLKRSAPHIGTDRAPAVHGQVIIWT